MGYEIKNAVIRSARIYIEDHGILTWSLGLDYGGICQGFGGYCLYSPGGHNPACVGRWIYRILQIADVHDWYQLVGKTIRVRCTYNDVAAIGNIVKEDWFEPGKEL